jgi:hypothetical protein
MLSLDLHHVRERSRTKELLPSTKDILEASLREVGHFRSQDLEALVGFTERAAYCLETALRGMLVLASKPLGSLLNFRS